MRQIACVNVIRLLWLILAAVVLASIRWPMLTHLIPSAFIALWVAGIVVAFGSLAMAHRGEKAAPIWIHGLLVGIAIVSVAATRWPLQLVVAASSSNLERLIDAAKAGNVVREPSFAGLTPIRSTTRLYGVWPVIVLDDDPSGAAYLMRTNATQRDWADRADLIAGWSLVVED
ncbi:MAG: hypothetical protein HONBIEJF_00883 [Fimbriimonadaceae bacterium]|nr:hypothetical protein [Fimbriimonadaceae bacterium]